MQLLHPNAATRSQGSIFIVLIVLAFRSRADPSFGGDVNQPPNEYSSLPEILTFDLARDGNRGKRTKKWSPDFLWQKGRNKNGSETQKELAAVSDDPR